jgi:hypothetical protein
MMMMTATAATTTTDTSAFACDWKNSAAVSRHLEALPAQLTDRLKGVSSCFGPKDLMGNSVFSTGIFCQQEHEDRRSTETPEQWKTQCDRNAGREHREDYGDRLVKNIQQVYRARGDLKTTSTGGRSNAPKSPLSKIADVVGLMDPGMMNLMQALISDLFTSMRNRTARPQKPRKSPYFAAKKMITLLCMGAT